MRNVEVDVPTDYDLDAVEKVIETLCTREGLSRKTKRTLRSHPGCAHWHYRMGRETGTLEITISPEESKIFFSVHDNRKGSWTYEYADRLAMATRRALAPHRKRITSILLT